MNKRAFPSLGYNPATGQWNDSLWTPICPRLAAIVTEVGIPAVVGCGNATMLLRTGDRVRVDGGAGTVEILSHPEAMP